MPNIKDLNIQSYFIFLKCMQRNGFISLQSLSSWNRIYKEKNRSFVPIKVYVLREDKVSMSDLSETAKRKLINLLL